MLLTISVDVLGKLVEQQRSKAMQFASVRLVTRDVDRLAAFYRLITSVEPDRPTPQFANFQFGSFALAISAETVVQQFNAGAAIAAANRSAIIEFQVDDVDAFHARLSGEVDVAMLPATMPWGNRSMLLRDPGGNVVNIFARPTAARG
jgi:uncharacterized glyoxalase superfamily protein PhnB